LMIPCLKINWRKYFSFNWTNRRFWKCVKIPFQANFTQFRNAKSLQSGPKSCNIGWISTNYNKPR
jgi:hypothetical protein